MERAIPLAEALEVEFKSERKPLPDSELIDTVVALSNTNGGTIYVGVEDDGRPTGVSKKHRDITQLAALIANKTEPPVSARVSSLVLNEEGVETEDGVQVNVIEIPRSRDIVASSDGKLMRRLLKANGEPESAPLYPYEIVSRLSTLGQMDYSAFPLQDTSLDDFDPNELVRLRSTLERGNGSDRALLELDDASLLAALQMTRLVDGNVTPTVTGILIAGKPKVIERVLPTSKAAFQVLSGTEVRANIDLDGPLLSTIERMRELFQPWNSEREVEFGFFRQSVPDFSSRAFREALVNAFGHRDYAMLGRVRVLIDDEGLTIANPGGFIEGVTLHNLLTVEPHGRNECLMNALKRIGLAEKTGRGVDRIYEGSLAYGRPLPDYSGTTSTYVKVFFARSKPDEQFMRMVNQEQERTGKTLSLRALLVLDLLKKQRRLTLFELTSQMGFAETVVRTTVESLVEAGLVEARGMGASRTYLLSPNVYKAAGKSIGFVHQTDVDAVRYPELILKLARQQDGAVTTRDVEELLHLSNKQAYRQIQKLVAEGYLTRRGNGRSARYELLS